MQLSGESRKLILTLRALFVIIILLSSSILVVGQIETLSERSVTNEGYTTDSSVSVESDDITIITTQGLKPRGAIKQPGDSPGEIIAMNSEKDVLYYNNTYHSYFDVDPVPDTKASVTYVAAEYRTKEECDIASACYINTIERVNLSTGEIERLYAEPVGADRPTRSWHDVDRYDEHRFVVAFGSIDGVTILNISSNTIEWAWRAAMDYPLSYGGSYGVRTWTHLNDVEILPDGRIMASLRNQNSVVFIDPESGLDESWTLGSPAERDVLRLQHNPDYLPETEGGPAVLIPDSRNNRIIEYQRVENEWQRSWVFRDQQMAWPRDADRLPNGHTLITDTNSDRVFEINQDNDIIWKLDIQRPYEAERLKTGDESTGGESAVELQLESYQGIDSSSSDKDSSSGDSVRDGFYAIVDWIVPDSVAQAAFFVAPAWMNLPHLIAVAIILGSISIWIPLELYWSKYQLRPRLPFEMRKE